MASEAVDRCWRQVQQADNHVSKLVVLTIAAVTLNPNTIDRGNRVVVRVASNSSKLDACTYKTTAPVTHVTDMQNRVPHTNDSRAA